MSDEENRLLDAIEYVRRDKHDPWRYILFTFLNGIAQGLGMALGMTIVLGILVFMLTKVLSQMIDFPVIGYYVGELMKLIETYLQSATKVR
jgi:hypothetical protein